MTDPDSQIRPRVSFAAPPAEAAEKPTLVEAKKLDPAQAWQPFDTSVQADVEEVKTSPETKKPRRFWLWLLVATIGLGTAELGLFTQSLFQRQDLLAGLWLVLIVVVLGLGLFQLVNEWRCLHRLKRQSQDKRHAEDLFTSAAIGQGRVFCRQLGNRLPAEHKPHMHQWQQTLMAHHTDKETLMLFEQNVLVEADKRAIACIHRHAAASAAMIAVSPFALLDMAIVLWRNLRMLNQISQAYGIRLGYWARIDLIRSVFNTMLYAGASEIIADAGNYALSSSLTGKVSSRLAQGMGAGVLTARIGIKTMQACRPMPWLSLPKPTLSAIAGQLTEKLKQQLG